MTKRTHYHPGLIFTAGTQVVALRDIIGQHGRMLHPRGAVGVVVKSPVDLAHAYRIRFPDGHEEAMKPADLALLALHKEGALADNAAGPHDDLFKYVAFQCIVGSQAYGLARDASDIDRRGFYIPPAELQWSLYGVPEQIENDRTQETYWEIQKFITLALKANPNVLECLYTPLVEKASPIAEKLLAERSIFLSRLVYQTYNGYVTSQFKKMQADIRNRGEVRWKHVMHLIRLLIAGVRVLREGHVQVRCDEHRDLLLSIRQGQVDWEEIKSLRLRLHREFDGALQQTPLPERPNYHRANELLIEARRAAAGEQR